MQRRRGYAPRTAVDVRGAEVVKESEHDAALEFAKALAIADVGDGGVFSAPRPLRYDHEARTVTYERIDVGVPLGRFIEPKCRRPSADVVSLFERAGEALGEIHARVQVDGGARRPVPPAVHRFLPPAVRRDVEDEARRSPVVSHGDYSVWNVFARSMVSPAEIVVLDCSPNFYSSFDAAAHESRYLDLALFDSCLFGRSGLRDYARLGARTLGPLRRAFVRGYERTAGVTVDARVLHAMSRAVLAAYFVDRRGWSPGLARAAARAISLRHWRHEMAPAADVGRGGVQDYRLSHASEGYATYYDRTILGGYYGAMLRGHEAPTVRAWVHAEAPRRVLDFACGTGRITSVLAETVPEVVGIDVSEEMLSRARIAVPGATFLCRDITVSTPEELRALEGGPFQVVTAFRFFQNAGPELRSEALGSIRALLAAGGALIMNVQSQSQSPAGRAYRLRAKLKRRSINQLSHAEVVELLDRHGFDVEETYWYGHFPRPGRVAGAAAAALDRPARAVADTLGVPSRHLAQMFLVRARLRD